MDGDCDGSVAIERVGDYAVDYRLVPLAAVAGKTKTMSDLFISDDGIGVTKAFDDYLRPLIGASMEQVHRLRRNPVAKILKYKWHVTGSKWSSAGQDGRCGQSRFSRRRYRQDRIACSSAAVALGSGLVIERVETVLLGRVGIFRL